MDEKNYIFALEIIKNRTTMKENESIIQVYLTRQDISKKVSVNEHVVDNGINHIEEVAPKLLLNNKDIVYVHLLSPLQKSEANNYLAKLCRFLVDNGKVQFAEFRHLSMPNFGGKYYSTYDTDGKLIEERYMIVYTK